MSYYLRGVILGALCDDCTEPLAGLELRLYAAQGERPLADAVAPDKHTFRALEDERPDAPLATATIGADGSYELVLEGESYEGGLLQVDLYCATPPRPKVGPHTHPHQFAVTTLQPRWIKGERGELADWDYTVPNRFWCYILGLFGIWTISGHLRTCDSGTPIAGAVVSAFDADWLQDDALGSAHTDAAGHFMISYLTAAFTPTIFPGINIELVGGPDVYFTATLGGTAILTEHQADGRAPGRQNIGHCFCVDLCSPLVQGNPETVAHWNQLQTFDIHPAPGLVGAQFSEDGYADPDGGAYVFGGGVSLGGNCPLYDVSTGHAVEYRFLVSEYSWSGTPDDPATFPTVAGTPTPITAVLDTLVGYLEYTDGNGDAQQADVNIGAGDVDPDGWIRVEGKAVTVQMYNPPGATAVFTVSASNFLRTFDLATINTVAITSAHAPKLPGGLPQAQAGTALSAAQQEPTRRYGLSFEARDAITPGSPLWTDSLPAVIFDNSPVILALDLEELIANMCNPLAGRTDVHILYTIDHPHLNNFSIAIGNNNGTRHAPPQTPSGSYTVPIAPPFFRGGAGGPHNSTDTGGVAVDISADPPCAYSVSLSWQTRHWQDIEHSTQVLYCS